MCGRFAQKSPPNQVAEFFDIKGIVPNFRERFNVAPTQDAAVITLGPAAARQNPTAARQIEVKKWGLVPSWSKDGKASFSTFNARAESVREKPAFREAFAARRCVVPADGFYEWTGAKGGKIPHFFTRQDGAMLALAGLHEKWVAADTSEIVQSFTILVTGANRWMSAFHDRMPVILQSGDIDRWLGGSAEAAAGLMVPAPEDTLQERIVSTQVNSVKNEGPALLGPDMDGPDMDGPETDGPAQGLFAL